MSPTKSLEEIPTQTATKITSIKALSESAKLTSDVASAYYGFASSPDDLADPNNLEFTVPVFDFLALTAGPPAERSQLLCDLAQVCRDWGCFIVKNHGVPETVMKGMIESCNDFFQLPEEKKQRFETKEVISPIKYGTSFNAELDKFLLWRDFLKIESHPQFYAPEEPIGLSEMLREFGKRTREVTIELMRAISESLGLEADYIHKEMNFEQCYQMIVTNYYPACPKPDLAIGIPHHTDHGLLTLLIDSGINGLQVEHNGKWVTVDSNNVPNSFFVNLADQLQILSNGKYKSVKHRASVNNSATRISIAIPHGPSLDTIVEPSSELGERAIYKAMSYKDYIELKLSKKGYEKSALDLLLI